MRQQLVTNGVMYCDDKRILYRREGGRCSGDMNTGLGNCLLMCGLVDGFVAGRFRYQLVNNGDDCVIIMERRCLNRLEGIERYFLDHGFTIKMEDDDHVKQYGETIVGFVSKFERLTFCQMRPVKVADGWIMVRCPNASFAKDSMALCQAVEWRKWIRAVGDGGVALYGDIPICSALYENYQRHGTACGNIKDSLLYQDTGFARMCKVRRCGKVEILVSILYRK